MIKKVWIKKLLNRKLPLNFINTFSILFLWPFLIFYIIFNDNKIYKSDNKIKL